MQNFPTGELDFGAPEGDPTMASLLAAARAGTVARRRVHSGDLRFRVRVKGDSLVEPVIEEESTRVFGDGPNEPSELQPVKDQQPAKEPR